MSNRITRLLAVMLGFVLVVSACGSDSDDAAPAATTAAPAAAEAEAEAPATTAAPAATEAPAPPEEPVNVGLVFDIGGRGDGSFNDMAYAGLEKAANELGANISDASPNSDGSNRPELLRLMAEANDLVIGVGWLFDTAMAEVAVEYPDTNFAIIDGFVDAPNVASLLYAEHEGSFLVGAAAGMKTGANVIGFIGGVNFPLINKFEAGFAAGVAQPNPDATVLVEYVTEPPAGVARSHSRCTKRVPTSSIRLLVEPVSESSRLRSPTPRTQAQRCGPLAWTPTSTTWSTTQSRSTS